MLGGNEEKLDVSALKKQLFNINKNDQVQRVPFNKYQNY